MKWRIILARKQKDFFYFPRNEPRYSYGIPRVSLFRAIVVYWIVSDLVLASKSCRERLLISDDPHGRDFEKRDSKEKRAQSIQVTSCWTVRQGTVHVSGHPWREWSSFAIQEFFREQI